MELFIMKKGIKNRVSSRLTKPVESLTSPEVMIFKLEQTAGENCRWLKRNLHKEDFKIVRFSETESEFFLHIDFWTFNFVKRIKAKLHKREFLKERTRLTSFGGRIWVREFKSRFLLTSCNFRGRRGTAPFSLEGLNPSGS